MGRYTGPSTRQSRREGVNLRQKPIRDESGKNPLEQERNFPPGVHLFRRGKASEYGKRLREKQKVKRYYGVWEKQFRRYFALAESGSENTGQNLLQILERRLDNVVYKTRFVAGKRGARQAVVHGHILVNGRKVDRPGYLVDVGDKITVHARERSQQYVRAQMTLIDGVANPPAQSWLNIDPNKLAAEVVALPGRDDVLIPVEEQLIVEFASR